MHFLIFAFSYLRFVVVANSAEFSSRWPVLSFSFFSFCVFFLLQTWVLHSSNGLQRIPNETDRYFIVFTLGYWVSIEFDLVGMGWTWFHGAMLGFIGFYWVLPGFRGLYWVSIEFDLVGMGWTWYHGALLDWIGFYRSLPGFTGFFLIIMSLTRFYWFLLGFTGFYWVGLDIMELSWILSGSTGVYWVLLGFT